MRVGKLGSRPRYTNLLPTWSYRLVTLIGTDTAYAKARHKREPYYITPYTISSLSLIQAMPSFPVVSQDRNTFLATLQVTKTTTGEMR